jgi:alpha,alpha-trehalase
MSDPDDSADAGRHAEDIALLAADVAPADTLSPADRYQELFVAVQTARVFDDSKTFVDCVPLQAPEAILEAYRARADRPDFNLARFVDAFFLPEMRPKSGYVSDPNQSLATHIDGLWSVLTRHPRHHPANSSLLPLPDAYVVPGGRFREMYYWDSYFTMIGLAESGRSDLLRTMTDNFAYLIDTFGHVPNGNRSYYLSRSQPPLFALMVDLLQAQGLGPAQRYLPRLLAEHAFWMRGGDDLRRGEAVQHCVRMADGSLLNRYWDARDSPREEMYLEDVTTAARSARPANDVYRDLRSAAASGWDFSSRWCDVDGDLSTTRTTSIVPVDLNCFLHALEAKIAQLAAACGEDAMGAAYRDCAHARRRAIDQWLWNEAEGAYLDYDLLHDIPRPLCAVTTAPLFVAIASVQQAQRVSETVATRLLEDGGVATTLIASGQQWDRPNGWAPLQWLTIRGLERYGYTSLGRDLRRRWLATVGSLYERESKLVEKYVLHATPAGAVGGTGGEYPLQDGFGWTNGVTRKLLHEDPLDPCHQLRAGHRHD